MVSGLAACLWAVPARAQSELSCPPSADIEIRVLATEGNIHLIQKNQPAGPLVTGRGTPLKNGDEIETWHDGDVRLLFDGRSLVRIGPDSDLTLESTKCQNLILHLEKGLLVAKIKRRLETQQIQFNTPDCTVLVRGTELAILRQDENSPTWVGIFNEGHLDVRAASGEIHIGPRQETLILKGSPLQPIQPMRYLLKLRQKMRAVRIQLFKITEQSKIRPLHLR